MPRPPRTPAHQAARALLRGTVGQHCASPHAAMQSAIPEEEWHALLEGRATRFFMTNGQRARKAVKTRHPMRPAGTR